MKKSLMLVLAGMSLLAMMDPVMAQGGGLVTMKGNLQSQASAVVDIISMGAYVIGVALGAKGILKIKEYSDTKGQVPISQGLIILAVAGCLLALPTILSTSKGMIGGNGAQGTSIGGGGLQTVN